VVLDLPPALISVGLLLVLLRLLGPWQLPLLAAWLCAGPVLCCPAAERWAVRVLYGLRHRTPAEAALLEPILMAAAARCGESVTGMDLYVRDRRTANAFAVGRRSVALTSGLLDAYRRRVLTGAQMTALVAHEVGHQATGVASHGGLLATWWTMPWTALGRFATGVGRGLVRGLPFGRASLLLVPVIVVQAAVGLSRRGQWTGLAALVLLVFAAAVQPLLEAAVARGAEYAADRYVAARGMGADLAAALGVLQRPAGRGVGQLGRLRADHPTTQDRIGRLQSHELSAPIGVA
jgi:STE24 endopeptidase